MVAPRRRWLAAGLLVAFAGCSQPGGLRAPGAAMGSMRASLGHLEYENEQLRKEVATLKDDNRKIENRLVQEESANGDLSARLDDARALLTHRGLDGGESSDALDPGPAPRRTLPAGRSNRKKRKTPFAQIPGQIDVLPPTDDNGSSSGWGQPSPPRVDDSDTTSSLDRPMNWLPIARGSVAPSPSRR
jgi:hypothetical protein